MKAERFTLSNTSTKLSTRVETSRSMIREFETWLHNRSYRLNTVHGIAGEAERFIQWCGSEAIEAEKTAYADLLNYIKYLQRQDNCKRTINQKLSVLKHYYNFLTEINQRKDNPALELRIRNEIRKVPYNLLSMEELEGIYKQYPTAGINNKRSKTLLGLLIYQGLHAGEIAALEPQDIKLKEGKIYIPATGRGNSRTLNLEAHQVIHMQNYILTVRPVLLSITDKQSDKLFVSTGSGQRVSNTIGALMKQVRKINSGVKNITQIRASIITEWLKKHNIRQVQYMIGHRYVSSTEHYRTDKLETLQEQLENLHPIK